MTADQWGEFAIMSLAIGLGAAWGAIVGWLAVIVAGLGVIVCMSVAVRKRDLHERLPTPRCERDGCRSRATHDIVGMTSQGNRPGGNFCERHATERVAELVDEGAHGMWGAYPLDD